MGARSTKPAAMTDTCDKNTDYDASHNPPHERPMGRRSTRSQAASISFVRGKVRDAAYEAPVRHLEDFADTAAPLGPTTPGEAGAQRRSWWH